MLSRKERPSSHVELLQVLGKQDWRMYMDVVRGTMDVGCRGFLDLGKEHTGSLTQEYDTGDDITHQPKRIS